MLQKGNALFQVLDSRYALIRDQEQNSNPEENKLNTTKATVYLKVCQDHLSIAVSCHLGFQFITNSAHAFHNCMHQNDKAEVTTSMQGKETAAYFEACSVNEASGLTEYYTKKRYLGKPRVSKNEQKTHNQELCQLLEIT